MFKEERRHLADETEDPSVIRQIVIGVAREAGIPANVCNRTETIALMDKVEEIANARS